MTLEELLDEVNITGDERQGYVKQLTVASAGQLVKECEASLPEEDKEQLEGMSKEERVKRVMELSSRRFTAEEMQQKEAVARDKVVQAFISEIIAPRLAQQANEQAPQ